MEIQITQEQVDAVVEAIVRKELDNLTMYDSWGDERYISLNEYVRQRAASFIDKYLEEKFGKLVDDEVAEIARMETMAAFLQKPVKISDGWHTSEYDSWTSFLLKRIHEKSLNDWNVNKRINDAIKKKVDELWSACAKKARQDALAAFQDELERAVPESVG